MRIPILCAIALFVTISRTAPAAEAEQNSAGAADSAKANASQPGDACPDCIAKGVAFPRWCPQFDIMTIAGEGELYYCYYYENSCDNIPEDSIFTTVDPALSDSCSPQCFPADRVCKYQAKTPPYDVVPPLPDKYNVGDFPFKSGIIRASKDQYVYIDRAIGDRVFYCIYQLLYLSGDPSKYHTFRIGLEIKPILNAMPLRTYTRIAPHWHTTEIGHEIVTLIGTNPKTAVNTADQPTPAKK